MFNSGTASACRADQAQRKCRVKPAASLGMAQTWFRALPHKSQPFSSCTPSTQAPRHFPKKNLSCSQENMELQPAANMAKLVQAEGGQAASASG